MSYDQGYWHTDACSEKGVPEENAATHIAAYVRWCIEKKLISEQLEQEDSEALKQVRSKHLSAAEYFEEHMDWKFGELSLDDIGNKFTAIYYNRYLADLASNFPNIICGKWSDVDYERLAQFLDNKLSEFRKGKLYVKVEKGKPWWRFW